MPAKREVLELLAKNELVAVLDAHDVAVDDRRKKDAIVDALSRARSVKVEDVLRDLSRDRLPLEKLIALPIWFPRRDEQEEVVAVLDSVLARERAEAAARAELALMKSALMYALLTGEVRVKPDSGES